MWFKRRPSDPAPPNPVNTINLMGRLDSVVDRLEGVSGQLIATLEQASEQRAQQAARRPQERHQ